MKYIYLILFNTCLKKYTAKMICIGSITNLYLGSIKKIENIIRLENKYMFKQLFENLFILKNKNRPGTDRIDIIIIGRI